MELGHPRRFHIPCAITAPVQPCGDAILAGLEGQPVVPLSPSRSIVPLLLPDKNQLPFAVALELIAGSCIPTQHVVQHAAAHPQHNLHQQCFADLKKQTYPTNQASYSFADLDLDSPWIAESGSNVDQHSPSASMFDQVNMGAYGSEAHDWDAGWLEILGNERAGESSKIGRGREHVAEGVASSEGKQEPSDTFYELWYIMSGQGVLIHHDGKEEPLRAGDSVLMRAGAARCVSLPASTAPTTSAQNAPAHLIREYIPAAKGSNGGMHSAQRHGNLERELEALVGDGVGLFGLDQLAVLKFLIPADVITCAPAGGEAHDSATGDVLQEQHLKWSQAWARHLQQHEHCMQQHGQHVLGHAVQHMGGTHNHVNGSTNSSTNGRTNGGANGRTNGGTVLKGGVDWEGVSLQDMPGLEHNMSYVNMGSSTSNDGSTVLTGGSIYQEASQSRVLLHSHPDRNGGRLRLSRDAVDRILQGSRHMSQISESMGAVQPGGRVASWGEQQEAVGAGRDAPVEDDSWFSVVRDNPATRESGGRHERETSTNGIMSNGHDAGSSSGVSQRSTSHHEAASNQTASTSHRDVTQDVASAAEARTQVSARVSATGSVISASDDVQLCRDDNNNINNNDDYHQSTSGGNVPVMGEQETGASSGVAGHDEDGISHARVDADGQLPLPALVKKRNLMDLQAYQLPNQTNRLALAFDPLEEGLEVSFGVEVFEPGHRTPPHVHYQAHELFFVLSGTGEAFCNGTRFTAKAGDCLVMPPTTVHGVDNESQERLYCLQVMLPNEMFVEFVQSGRAVGRLEDEDLCNLISVRCGSTPVLR